MKRFKQPQKTGKIVHPAIAAKHAQMRNVLILHGSALEKSDLAAARTNMNIAIEYASRVMNEFGR
ncbi:MAG: hypothetical protein LAO78_22715 [Acidobacteriia bacterium]|nr:hypothetical protein [Terriglobia bacterium]